MKREGQWVKLTWHNEWSNEDRQGLYMYVEHHPSIELNLQSKKFQRKMKWQRILPASIIFLAASSTVQTLPNNRKHRFLISMWSISVTFRQTMSIRSVSKIYTRQVKMIAMGFFNFVTCWWELWSQAILATTLNVVDWIGKSSIFKYSRRIAKRSSWMRM